MHTRLARLAQVSEDVIRVHIDAPAGCPCQKPQQVAHLQPATPAASSSLLQQTVPLHLEQTIVQTALASAANASMFCGNIDTALLVD